MAQLCSAVEDGHLYILAGQSQGTWQVNKKGEIWLRERSYKIPNRGESIHLDRGTYLKLKDMDCLYIKGIEYDKKQQDTSISAQNESGPIIEGLPLILLLKESRQPNWELALDLSALNEGTWKDLQSRSADRINASDALNSLSQIQLLSANYLLKVRPRLLPYLIFKESIIHIKHVLREAPETPGLNSTWQGNVFSEYAHQKGAWRRRLPGRTIAFSGTLLWLARSEYDPEWPSITERLSSSSGWQLWRLSVNEQMPPSWEELERWFTYRIISIAPQRQSLEVLSPPLAITANAQFVMPMGKQVLLGCHPPFRTVEGLDKRAVLTAELLERSGSSIVTLSRDPTLPFPADQASYFRWTPLHLGEYRLRIQGDASSDPLLICVVNKPPIQPRWLCGLTCTIDVLEKRQTFQAFSNLSDSRPVQIVQIEREELPAVRWILEPEQLPIRVTWNVHPQHEASENTGLVRSGDEFMQSWQDYILPALANKHQARMMLDAGSFGRIELSIVISQLAQEEQEEQVPIFDERVILQVIWLSRMIGCAHQQKLVHTPVAMQRTLQNLHKQADINSAGFKALARLTRAKKMPAWVYFRLRVLLAEVQERGEHNGIPETNDIQEEEVV